MKDPKTNQFNIWYADHWHHLCIRYAKATSSIAIVKVSLSLCFKRFGDNQINFAEKRCLYLSFENTQNHKKVRDALQIGSGIDNFQYTKISISRSANIISSSLKSTKTLPEELFREGFCILDQTLQTILRSPYPLKNLHVMQTTMVGH